MKPAKHIWTSTALALVPIVGDTTEIDNSLWWILGLGVAALVVAFIYWLMTRKKYDAPIVDELDAEIATGSPIAEDMIEAPEDIEFIEIDLR